MSQRNQQDEDFRSISQFTFPSTPKRTSDQANQYPLTPPPTPQTSQGSYVASPGSSGPWYGLDSPILLDSESETQVEAAQQRPKWKRLRLSIRQLSYDFSANNNGLGISGLGPSTPKAESGSPFATSSSSPTRNDRVYRPKSLSDKAQSELFKVKKSVWSLLGVITLFVLVVYSFIDSDSQGMSSEKVFSHSMRLRRAYVTPPSTNQIRKRQKPNTLPAISFEWKDQQELSALTSFLIHSGHGSEHLPENHLLPGTNQVHPEFILDIALNSPRLQSHLTELDNVWTDNPVILFGLSQNEDTREIQAILQSLTIKDGFRDIPINTRADGVAVKSLLSRLLEQPNLPVLVVGGEVVGGLDEVLNLIEDGSFKKKLKLAGVEFIPRYRQTS